MTLVRIIFSCQIHSLFLFIEIDAQIIKSKDQTFFFYARVITSGQYK